MRRLIAAGARLWAPGWAGNCAAVGGGVLITLSLAPFHFWPAGILGIALLHGLLQRLTPGQAALRGWWFGAGLFLSGTSWVYVSIHDYGYASVPLAAALSGGYCLGLALLHSSSAWVYVRFLRDLPGGRWLGFAAIWVLWEWLRAWLLTGFPWLYVGYAHLTTPLGGWAPVLGVYGVSLGVVLTAVALALALQLRASQPRRAWLALGLGALPWLGGAVLQSIEWTRPNGEAVTVALVQANIPQSVKWDRERFHSTLDLYRDLSAPLWPKAQIVIWSEAAIPALYDQARDFFEAQAAAAAPYNSTLISGVPYREPPSPERPDGGIYNSAVALGNGGGVYHKQHLVPFGEYVPLQQWLRGLIRFFDLPMSDFSAGPAGQDPLRAGAVTLAPFICYEIVYPDLVRHARADVLLTLSNDAWFGRSIGPLQHLEMAQMRALENGRDVIRATGNGVTALIDQRGRISARLPQFETAVLTGTVQPRAGATPFSRTGSRPVLILCGLLILRCFLARRLA
jgi:apolipoprotein N-acyltransferase